MADDHRQLIIYSAVDALVVGNHFIGNDRGALGLFNSQNAPVRNLRYLSNFIENNLGTLCQIELTNSPYRGYDVAFINNLEARAARYNSQTGASWAYEWAGTSNPIGPSLSLTAGHGVNFLHNTVRNNVTAIFPSPAAVNAFVDFRYNVTSSGSYWISTSNPAVDYPSILVATNRVVDVSGMGYPPPAPIPPDNWVANESGIGYVDAAGLGSASVADPQR